MYTYDQKIYYMKGNTYMNTKNVMNELARINYKHYDSLTREKVAWMDRHLELEEAGYVGYALTVTYLPNPKSPKGHNTKTLERHFKKLYFHNLVRYQLFDGHSRWTSRFHEYQPYIDVFQEAHEHAAIYRPHLDERVWKEFEFSERLHHHAVMYVHPMHAEKMNALIGDNTLNKFNPRAVMTSHVALAKNIGWTGYSLKCHHKFHDSSMHFGPENLDFPACKIIKEIN
jgi:ribosomal protein L33